MLTTAPNGFGDDVHRVGPDEGRRVIVPVGDLQALGDLGVIDGAQARILMEDALAGRTHRYWLGWVWQLLNIEPWIRAHR